MSSFRERGSESSHLVAYAGQTYTSIMKRRMAQLPLHGGKAPAWLFGRMTRLAGAVTMAVVDEFGPKEMLRRLADPWWFQAFGCMLGFDWHSSGVTTVTCGALKEAYRTLGDDLGIVVAGGKGAAGRKTPREISEAAEHHAIVDGDKLIHASRMSAKVDSAAVQDGFEIYHHTFALTPSGQWCVVQQGMNTDAGWARRYHWLGESVDDFVCEPHAAVRNLGETGSQPEPARKRQRSLLNLVALEADENRRASAALVREHPEKVLEQLKQYTEGPTLFAPKRHRLLKHDVDWTRLQRILITAHERSPQDFETLLETPGVGAATLRSLALLAELIFEAPVSRRDPTIAGSGRNDATEPHDDPTERHWADYAYAHGGKDGTPFPVDRETYDRNISLLIDAVRKARVGQNEKFHALKRLAGSQI